MAWASAAVGHEAAAEAAEQRAATQPAAEQSAAAAEWRRAAAAWRAAYDDLEAAQQACPDAEAVRRAAAAVDAARRFKRQRRSLEGAWQAVLNGPLTRADPCLELGHSRLALPQRAEHTEVALAAVRTAAAARQGDPSPRFWRLPAKHVRITNPRWQRDVVSEAVRQAKAGLGLDSATGVEARLSCLMVWQQGEHLKAMAGSCAPGVPAQLAILLPSSFEGGKLQISFGRRTATVDFADLNADSSFLLAFRSGCMLGSQPLTSCTCLLLLYDLLLTGQVPPPPLLFRQDPAARLLALAQQYDACALRELGVEALHGQDKVAAQALLAACQAGAELDALLALLTCKARPGVTYDEAYRSEDCDDDGCSEEPPESYLEEPPEHIDEDSYVEWLMEAHTEARLRAVQEAVEERIKGIVLENKEWHSLTRRRIQASSFAPLVGAAPPAPLVCLSVPESLCMRRPFGVHGLTSLEFRRVGLLVWPRRKRLLNAVHTDLAGYVLRLHALLSPGEQQQGQQLSSLAVLWGWRRDQPKARAAFGADEQPDGSESESDSDSTPSNEAPPEPSASPAQLTTSIAAYLSERRCSPAAAGEDMKSCDMESHCLAVMMQLAIQLADQQLAASLLQAAAARAVGAAAVLGLAAARALKQPKMQEAGHGWCSEKGPSQAVKELLDSPSRLLLALAGVPTAGGELALQVVVGAVGGGRRYGPDHVAGLRTTCSTLLSTLPCERVAVEPVDWRKPKVAEMNTYFDDCKLKDFMLDPEQQECVLPDPPRDWSWRWHRDIEVAETKQDGRASWRITKRHTVYEQAAAAYRARMAQQRALLDLLAPCLLLAVPAGAALAAEAELAGPAAKAPNTGSG
ncbi:hypothetical protein ABPG75_007623 [Micractinium tetrahymenae]